MNAHEGKAGMVLFAGSSSSSSRDEYYLGGTIALLLQDHRTMSTKLRDPCLSALSVPPWPKRRYINTLPFLSMTDALAVARQTASDSYYVICSLNVLHLSSFAFSYIGGVTARHWSSGRQPNFAAWYKERNYGTFTDGATCTRQGAHHVRHRPTF